MIRGHALALSVACALLALPSAPAVALSLPSWPPFASEAADSGPPRPVVTEILMDRGEALRWVPGVIASRTEVDMAFQTLGRMIVRHVDLGDRVEDGDLLAELATEDLAATTRAAQAAVDAAEVELSTAQSTLDRVQALAARDFASDAQLEQAQRAAASARAAAAQARSELVRAEDSEGFATMTAPFAGVVSAVYEAPGAVVGAGAPILQLSAEGQREAVIDLPEITLAGLPRDAAFTVWQRTEPTVEISARLERIEPMADTATRTRRLHLRLPPEAPFRLGALVRARLGTAREPVLTVASKAVFERDGRSWVWCVLRENAGDEAGAEAGAVAHVRAVPVKAGAEFQGRIVINKGLKVGDEIVIRGVRSLKDGQAVGRRVVP